MRKSVLVCVMGLWICFGCLFSTYGADQGMIASGETRAGFQILAPSYMDTWTFQGNAGDRILFNAEKTTGSLSTWVALYPPDGGASEASGFEAISRQLAQSGEYTVVVSDYGNNDEGTYNVSFLKIPGSVSSAEDPDGGAIASGQTLMGMTITPIADMDAFQFYGDAGERILFNAEKITGSLSTWVTLYPPDGSASEASGFEAISRQLAQSGVYTVVVSDYGNDAEGTYNVSFLKIPGAVSSPGDLDGGAIASGQTLMGMTITPIADMDAFYFYGQAGDRALFITATTVGSLSTWVALYPQNGGASEASGFGSIDRQLAQSGLYTVVVSDYGNDAEGTYSVSFSKIPSQVRPGIYNPSPVEKATINTLGGSFQWDAVTGATGYDLYFGENVITPLQQIGTNLTSPTRVFPALQSGKVYYWHVVAHTATGDIQGPYWWFKTEPTPAAYLLWTK